MAQAGVRIGTVTRMNPARREIRVDPEGASARTVESLEWVTVHTRDGDRLRCRVTGCRVTPAELIVALAAGVTRDSVARMKGAIVYAGSTEAFGEAHEALSAEDLLGLAVVDERGTTLGVAAGMIPTAAHDVLEVETPNGGSLLIPLIPEVVAGVDEDASRLYLRDIGPYAVHEPGDAGRRLV